MKVITWNLNYWQNRSMHDEAWRILRDDIKPDLALLQEVSPPELMTEESLLFKSIHQNWGTAIYSRNTSVKEEKIDNYPGRVVAATFEISSEDITAVSVHAPIINQRVFPYLDGIFDKLENILVDRTFIVGGDLNTARLAEKVWPRHGHGPFFERLADSLFFDCHWKFHHGEQQTFFRNGVKYPFQDDHIFVSHNLA